MRAARPPPPSSVAAMSPLLGYAAFSHLLQRHPQGVHGVHQGSPMTSPPGLGRPPGPGGVAPVQGRGLPMPLAAVGAVPPGVPQFLASSLLQHLQAPPHLSSQLSAGMACPSPSSPCSSVSPSPSSSPPTSLSGMGLAGTGKSFTIDAILGLSAHAAPQHDQGRYLHYPLGEPATSPTDLSLGNSARPQQQQQHSPRRTTSGGADGAGCPVSSGKKVGGGGGGGGKCKRVRTIFTADQLERLEREFEHQQYMVGPERLYLAHALNLTEAQVKVWFQNRRIKWRKQHLEIEQQRLAAIKHHPLLVPQHVAHLQQHLQGGGDQDDAHRDMDSDDSAMSEDRTYFASMVMPGGVAPDGADEQHQGGRGFGGGEGGGGVPQGGPPSPARSIVSTGSEANQGHQDYHLGHQDHQDHQGHQGHQGHLEHLEHQGHPDHQGHLQDHQDQHGHNSEHGPSNSPRPC